MHPRSFRQFCLALTLLVGSQSHADNPPPNQPSPDLASRIDGFTVAYDVKWYDGTLEARTASNTPSIVPSAFDEAIANWVRQLTNGAVAVKYKDIIGRGALDIDLTSGRSDINFGSGIGDAEKVWVVSHELSHYDQISKNGPMNFAVQGENTLSIYPNGFHASEVAAFAVSQAAFGAIIVQAAISSPAEVPELISRYYYQDTNSWIGTFNATYSAVNTMLPYVTDTAIVNALTGSPTGQYGLADGYYLNFVNNNGGTAIQLVAPTEVTQVAIFLMGDFGSKGEALAAIAQKLIDARAELQIISPNSAQSIAVRNQNDAAIQLALSIAGSQVSIPVGSLFNANSNWAVSRIGGGCVGTCPVNAGVIAAVINQPSTSNPPAGPVANTATVIAAATTALTNASTCKVTTNTGDVLQFSIGQSGTFFYRSPSACLSQVRSCSLVNGVARLSGSYTGTFCGPPPSPDSPE